jgi:hypothetical protein
MKFKIHSMTTNEIFLAVGELCCLMVSELMVGASDCYAAVNDFSNVLWWDVVTAPIIASGDPNGLVKALEMKKTLMCMCEESVGFLKEHVKNVVAASGEDLPEQFDEIFSRDNFGRIVGTFEQNAIGVRVRHPIYEKLTEGSDLGKRVRTEGFEEIVKAVRGIRAKIGEEGGGECDDDDCEDGEEDEEDEDEDDEEEIDIDGITDVSSLDAVLFGTSCHSSAYGSSNFDSLFPPLDGTCLFSTACKMNHSCAPNVFVHYKGGYGSERPLRLECVAVKDIAVGEELCISYVDCEMGKEEREEELDNYGFKCGCIRCVDDVEEEEEEEEEEEGDSGEEDDEEKPMCVEERIKQDYFTPASIVENKTTSDLPTTYVPSEAVEQACDFIVRSGDSVAGLKEAADERDLFRVKVRGEVGEGKGAEMAKALAFAHEGKFNEAKVILEGEVGEEAGDLKAYVERVGC